MKTTNKKINKKNKSSLFWPSSQSYSWGYLDTYKFIFGLALIFLGIMMPLMTLNIYSEILINLRLAYSNGNEADFLLSALALVFMNSIRAFPHYIGTFFLAESIHPALSKNRQRLIKILIICTLIPLIYWIINHTFYGTYDFSTSAISMIILLGLIGDVNYSYISNWKKTLLIVLFITGMQCLDIIPALNFLPVGRGELSMEVKDLAYMMELTDQLNLVSISLVSLFTAFSIVTFLLIRDENRLLALDELKRKNTELESASKLKDMENRTFQEMSSIVHDLKTPLTSAQALVGLVKMNLEGEGEEKNCEYLSKVEDSIDQMSNMISEVLNPLRAEVVSANDIVKDSVAYISIADFSSRIQVEDQTEGGKIYVNKYTFIRILVNLLNNAGHAIAGKEDGRIKLTAARRNDGGIDFSVEDNGVGISEKDLSKILDQGFSKNHSTGLGMTFVQENVKKFNGQLDIKSQYGKGSKFTIHMEEVDCD